MTCCWCLFLLPGAAATPQSFVWTSSLKKALQDQRNICIPENLRQALLWEEQDDFYCFDEDNIDDDDEPFLFKGFPKRPLYKELGHRLWLISLNKNNDTPLLLPAEHFGLSEHPVDPCVVDLLPDHPNKRSLCAWLNRVGSRGILLVMGLRNTIGTDPRTLLPPSFSDLLEAAALPHKKERSDLSVAARARSKHAHRGREHFFGCSSGSPCKQNAETQEILIMLLKNAAWINIHAFGGTNGEPCLEIRVASGYGARWKADWSIDPMFPRNVSFRGFLEPQMSDGHEQRWRH